MNTYYALRMMYSFPARTSRARVCFELSPRMWCGDLDLNQKPAVFTPLLYLCMRMLSVYVPEW